MVLLKMGMRAGNNPVHGQDEERGVRAMGVVFRR